MSDVVIPIKRGAVLYFGFLLFKQYTSVGVHGYEYNTEVPKKGHGCKKGFPAATGYNLEKDPKYPAVSVEHYFERVYLEKVETNPEIKQMEAISAAVLEYLKERLVVATGEFALGEPLNDVLMFVPSPLIRNWNKAADIVTNKLDRFNDEGVEKVPETYYRFIEEFLALTEQFKAMGTDVKWKGYAVNTPSLGDGLADKMAKLPKSDWKIDYSLFHRYIALYKTEDYWAYTYENHRLLSSGRWYFTADVDPVKDSDGWTIYTLARRLKKEEEEQIGKPIPNLGLSVVMLKEPEPLLEKVRRKQQEVMKGDGAVIRALTSEIFSNRNAYQILFNADHSIKRASKQNANLELPGQVVITEECNPPLLSHRILTEYEKLYQRYLQYKANDPILSVSDVTSWFYDFMTNKKGEVKTVFKKELPVGIKQITIPVIYDQEIGKKELILTFNIDMPDRNALSSIADENPKVTVIVWKDGLFGHRFAVVIETDTARGVWSGVYSNLVWKAP